jgi:hypothetical protein
MFTSVGVAGCSRILERISETSNLQNSSSKQKGVAKNSGNALRMADPASTRKRDPR